MTIESKAWQRRVTALWTDGLDGRQIRRVESLQPALLPDGRRLRGVMLAPGLCLARDKRFFEVIDGQAFELTAGAVLVRYSANTLHELFRAAAKATRNARRNKTKRLHGSARTSYT